MILISSMSVLLIVGPKYMLVVSHAAPWWVSVSMLMDRWKSPYHYIMLSAMDAASVIIWWWWRWCCCHGKDFAKVHQFISWVQTKCWVAANPQSQLETVSPQIKTATTCLRKWLCCIFLLYVFEAFIVAAVKWCSWDVVCNYSLSPGRRVCSHGNESHSSDACSAGAN